MHVQTSIHTTVHDCGKGNIKGHLPPTSFCFFSSGTFHYVSMSYEGVDIILLPLPNERNTGNKKPRLLGISVIKPYDVTKLLEKLHIA